MALSSVQLHDGTISLIHRWVAGQPQRNFELRELRLQFVHALRYFTEPTTKVVRYDHFRQELEQRSHRPCSRRTFNDRINSVSIELAHCLSEARTEAVDAAVERAIANLSKNRAAEFDREHPAIVRSGAVLKSSGFYRLLKASAIYSAPVDYRTSIRPYFPSLPFSWGSRWSDTSSAVIIDRVTGQTFRSRLDPTTH